MKRRNRNPEVSSKLPVNNKLEINTEQELDATRHLKDVFEVDDLNKVPKALLQSVLMSKVTSMESPTENLNKNFKAQDKNMTRTMIGIGNPFSNNSVINDNYYSEAINMVADVCNDNNFVRDIMSNRSISINVKNKIIGLLNSLSSTVLDYQIQFIIKNAFYVAIEKFSKLVMMEYDIIIDIGDIIYKYESNYTNYRAIPPFNPFLVARRYTEEDQSLLLNCNDDEFNAIMDTNTKIYAKTATVMNYNIFLDILRNIIYSSDTKGGLIDLSVLYNFLVTFGTSPFIEMENQVGMNILAVIGFKTLIDKYQEVYDYSPITYEF